MRTGLDNVTVADTWSEAATLKLVGARRVLLQVANAAVYYQLDESGNGAGGWGEERFLTPTVGSLDRDCSGIRFRNALAGAVAQVSCELSDDPGGDALSPFTSSVSAAGGVSPVTAERELAYQEFTGTVVVSALTEATANLIVQAAAITVDGTKPIVVEFFASSLYLAADAAGNSCQLALYEDGVSIGRWCVVYTTNNIDLEVPLYLARRFTPAGGSHTYSVRAYRGNANCEVRAGGGGVGNRFPGSIRLAEIVT